MSQLSRQPRLRKTKGPFNSAIFSDIWDSNGESNPYELRVTYVDELNRDQVLRIPTDKVVWARGHSDPEQEDEIRASYIGMRHTPDNILQCVAELASCSIVISSYRDGYRIEQFPNLADFRELTAQAGRLAIVGDATSNIADFPANNGVTAVA